MMATKESSQITMHELDGLKFSKSYWLNTSTQENQHIYITTGEEIKDGDEFWYNNGGEWFRAIYRDYYKAYFPYGRKIIATTDNSLHLPYVLPGEEDLDVYRYEISPEIQERFIEEFCKAGGIDKVMVEMQSKCSKLGFECSAKINISCQHICSEFIPKIDSNNCITIHPVEEKVYSKEEVFKLMELAIKHGIELERNKVDFNVYSQDYIWIQEKL
jgi:hypothetical protein